MTKLFSKIKTSSGALLSFAHQIKAQFVHQTFKNYHNEINLLRKYPLSKSIKPVKNWMRKAKSPQIT
jgi:hypothetical protein